MKRTLFLLFITFLTQFAVSLKVNAENMKVYKGTITINVGEEKTMYHSIPYQYYVTANSWFLRETSGSAWSDGQEGCGVKIVSKTSESCTIKGMWDNEDLFNYNWCELHCKGTKNSTGEYYECYWKVIVKSKGDIYVDATPAAGVWNNPTMVEAGTKVYLTARTSDGSSASDAQIYYRIDGEYATVNSTPYTSAGITITKKTYLSAIASKSGYSPVTLGGYYDVIFKVTNITLNKTSLSLQPEQSETLTATVLPSNATDKSVTWTSSSTSVATVDSNGKVTAKAKGSATITCKANDGSGVQATCAVTVSEPVVAEINATNFPDASFRNWLLSQSYGADGKLTASEISSITSIDVSGSFSSPGTISSLKGIEYFTSLKELRCSYNQLTSLDVSKNTVLTDLYCYSNQLTSLDVSKNTALTRLYCHINQLTSLDVSKNTALTTLWLYENLIKGPAMDALISSLPQNQTSDVHYFYVIFNIENDEGNVCTVAQVAAAKAKGWSPMYFNGTKWTDYEGSEEPDLGPDDLTDISLYANIVYLETVTASPESTISVPVKMKNAQANIMGFQFDLILPTGVTVAKDEDGFYLIELSTERTTTRKHTVSAQQQSDGSIRVVCYSNNNSTFSGTSGNVLEVMLQVAADAPTGEQSIKLRDVVMTTPGLDSYTVPWVVSRLTVEDYILGDVNGDKLVNVVDVAGVVNLILNNGDTSKLNRKAADVNSDGNINVVDVAGVVNIILGGGANGTRTQTRAGVDASLLFFLTPSSIPQGETSTMHIKLQSNEDKFTGCQFDLYLPEGLSVEEEDGFPLVEIGSGTTTRRHVVSTSAQPDGALRVVCYSNNNYVFNDTEIGSEILTATIRVAGDAPLGKCTIALRNITLSRPDATGVSIDDWDATYCAVVPSGIDDITADQGSDSKVFSLSGQRLAAPLKGVNIVGGRKVVVK